ncbi:hypothetical protein ROA7450_03037 [Roseovarius albus]|uniref:Uncharacterized protein n=1 Tax=Roseovarius albus TaxID=1247867 RepID=A0A1X6ZR52_9RHOB|nr:hypothetical protein ROA7450_03037 [Roseovarius albus]
MIVHAELGQTSSARDEAVDSAFRSFAPKDVEGAEFGVEPQMGMGQVVVDPPGERAPIRAFDVAIRKPRDDDASCSAFLAVTV